MVLLSLCDQRSPPMATLPRRRGRCGGSRLFGPFDARTSVAGKCWAVAGKHPEMGKGKSQGCAFSDHPARRIRPGVLDWNHDAIQGLQASRSDPDCFFDPSPLKPSLDAVAIGSSAAPGRVVWLTSSVLCSCGATAGTDEFGVQRHQARLFLRVRRGVTPARGGNRRVVVLPTGASLRCNCSTTADVQQLGRCISARSAAGPH